MSDSQANNKYTTQQFKPPLLPNKNYFNNNKIKILFLKKYRICF